MNLYAKTLEQRDSTGFKNERNDCSVVAVSLVCGVSYAEAHLILKKLGRRNRCSTDIKIIMQAVAEFGCSYYNIAAKPPVCSSNLYKRFYKPNCSSSYTPKTITAALSKGEKYICFTVDHCFAVIGGNVQDWAKDRRLRITQVFKVNKKPG